MCQIQKDESIRRVIEDNIHDSRKLWKELNKIVKGQSQMRTFMYFDGIKICDKLTVANKYNEFTINSIRQICDNITHTPYVSPIVNRLITRWTEFELIDTEAVMNILNCTKTKSGLNNVNPAVIKMIVSNCPYIIVNVVVYNDSLQQGICPDVWKYTVITPVPKIKNSAKSEEMRPINRAPTLDKILEALVDDDETNSIITQYQSAFCEKHSCETTLNCVINMWKQKRAQRRKIIVLFMDLQKAFETVNRAILIQKLENYGLEGTVLKWFKNWLTNRVQYVSFCGVKSEPLIIESGIPQGTPLSCPLFNVYINDIVNNVDFCHINVFADDTILWIDADTI